MKELSFLLKKNNNKYKEAPQNFSLYVIYFPVQ